MNGAPSKRLVILGAGGIGGNFATMFYHNIRHSEKDVSVLAVYDDDVLEITNINRLPYSVLDTGNTKVSLFRNKYQKTKEQLSISTANGSISSPNFPYYENKRINNERDFLNSMGKIFNFPEGTMTLKKWEYIASKYHIVVIDCRDTRNPEAIFPEIDIKLTYNGGNIFVIEFNPDETKNTYEDDGQNHYTITPSFFAPPVMEVNLVLNFVRVVPFFIYGTTKRRINHTLLNYYSLSELIYNSAVFLDEDNEAVSIAIGPKSDNPFDLLKEYDESIEDFDEDELEDEFLVKYSEEGED